ncbi:MAG: ABC transporter substrate-binding protein [Oscillospiraceae bacterium]|jgi:ribose transport system substrate-binding protein|nr:ABC transporter substrate-binding protein [Oscillospiraceae bacterium]
MKKVLAIALALGLLLTCAAPALAETPYIAVISKGFQHQFWQTVYAGSKDAAEKYGVEITFEGPPSESDIQIQIDMLNAAITKNPSALALAALDTESVIEQLLAAKEKGVPVIGFDSGVPNAPEGTILSTASTDNEAAGALAAEKMFEIESVKAAIEAATPEAPITLSSFSQDATSGSIVGRTVGYINKMYELVNEVKPGQVAITGHDKYLKPSESGSVAVEIQVTVPASTNVQDCQTSAQGILANSNLVSIFCSNSGSVDGVLAATADGSDLDKTNGKYKDLVVIGFDSGAPLKNAVRNQWFYGAVTQDPYMIGYYAIELAVKALNGETIDETVDTGCQFYTYENMDEPSIAQLLYD